MPAPAAKLEHTGQNVKLGRLPATADMKRRAIPLKPFLKKYGGKPPPKRVDWHTKAANALAEMLGNDLCGNCVVAAELHGVGAWSANEPGGAEAVATRKEAVDQYKAICGPGDNGCYIPSVLEAFRDYGLVVAGSQRKMEGFVTIDPRDQLMMQYATWLFGGIHLGVNWPSDWMNIKPGFVLKPTNSRMVGGHAIMVVGYDDKGLTVSTWGMVGTLSWEALADSRFVDEAYARLGADWYNADGITAAGVDVTALRDVLKVVAAGGYPDIPNDPTPPPPPTPPVPPGGSLTASGTVDFFGQQLPVNLTGTVASANGAGEIAAVNWWAVLMDVAAIMQAARARDWVALAAAVEKLLRDIGMKLDAAERAQVVKHFVNKMEAAALTDPYPPSEKSGVDTSEPNE